MPTGVEQTDPVGFPAGVGVAVEDVAIQQPDEASVVGSAVAGGELG